MPSIRRAITVSIAFAALACDSGLAPGETLDTPIVTVAAATVAPGTIVDMQARNLSATSWRYNPCASPTLQRREADSWVDAPDPLILCAPDQETLAGGATRTIGVGVPVGIAAGTYRILFRIVRSDGIEAAPATNTFAVQ